MEINANKALLNLSEIASEAHAKIQQDFKEINPVIGVVQAMRRAGIPADAMTIDCLQSKKRILIILHDQHPDIMQYQFMMLDQDPGDEYQRINSNEVSVDTIYDWIQSYFTAQ